MKKRGAIVIFRLSAEEKSAWQSRADADQMTLTDFVRLSVDEERAKKVGRAPKKRRLGRKADPLLLANIGRVGSNLNQIARWANRYKSAADAAEILLALVAVEKQLLSSYRPDVGVDDD